MKRQAEYTEFLSNKRPKTFESMTLRQSPYAFGDSFVLNSLNFIADFEGIVTELNQGANPLYTLRYKYPSQDPFWFHLAAIALLANCAEIYDFIHREGLIQEKKLFLMEMKVAVISSNLGKLRRLFQNFDRFSKAEIEVIKDTLIQLFRDFNQNHDLLPAELLLFKSKYPDEYSDIWLNTYPDYRVSNHLLASTPVYLENCLLILQFLCSKKNPCPISRDEILKIMNAIFWQQQYSDHLLPEDYQNGFVLRLINLTGRFVHKSEFIPWFLTFFIKQQLFIPLKYFLYRFEIFENKEHTQLFFTRILEQENIPLLCMAFKFHDAYLSQDKTNKPADKSILQTILFEKYKVKKEYFALIAEDYPDILDQSFNLKINNSYPIAYYIQESFRNCFAQKNRNYIPRYFKIKNFLHPEFMAALVEKMTVEDLVDLYAFPEMNALLIGQQDYLNLAISKGSMTLLKTTLEKYTQGRFIPDRNFLILIEQILQTNNHRLLVPCFSFREHPVEPDNDNPLGSIIIKLILRNAMDPVLQCLLKDPDLTLQALAYTLAHGKKEDANALISCNFFIKNLPLTFSETFIKQCLTLIDKTSDTQTKYMVLKLLLHKMDMVNLQQQLGGMVTQGSLHWYYFLGQWSFSDQGCQRIIQEHISQSRDNTCLIRNTSATNMTSYHSSSETRILGQSINLVPAQPYRFFPHQPELEARSESKSKAIQPAPGQG